MLGVDDCIVVHSADATLVCNKGDSQRLKELVSEIEKKYGKPIAHWMQVLNEVGPLKHMELVCHLKSEHQMGHGHANALVAWFMAKK